MKSLDPRVTRLPEINAPAQEPSKSALDQFGTFEVFVKPKAGKPFQHEGSVHAPNLEMAYILAKETFTRRFTCSSLCVVATIDVVVSPITEGSQNIYDTAWISHLLAAGENTSFEIYHLTKRGKQHIHFGTVEGNVSPGSDARCKKTNSQRSDYFQYLGDTNRKDSLYVGR